MDNKVFFWFAIILIVGISLRALTIRYGTLMESDSYAYLSVIQQTVSNNLILTSNLSGFPIKNQYNEAPLLIWISAIPSYYLNIKPIILVASLPLIFGIIEIISVYILAYQLTKDSKASLISMGLFAVTASSIFRSSIGEYRGDSFAPALAGLAIISLIAFNEKKNRFYFLISMVFFVLAINIWNGGIYLLAAVILFGLLIGIYNLKRNVKITVGYSLIIIAIMALIGFTLNLIPQSNSNIAETQPATLGFLVSAHGLELIFCFIGLGYLIKENKNKLSFFIIYSLLIVTGILQLSQIRFEALIAMPIAIFAGYGVYRLISKDISSRRDLAYSFLTIVFIIQFFVSTYQVLGYKPAENINPQFISAAQWLSINTAQNATVATLWTDGSVVEAIGNRLANDDSVMGQNSNNTIPFERFLMEKRGNYTYLNQKMPNYLLIRKYWKNEGEAIAQEANVSYNYHESNLNGFISDPFSMSNSQLKVVYISNDTIIYKVNKSS